MKSQMPAASQDKIPSKEQDKTMNASQNNGNTKHETRPSSSSLKQRSDEGRMASNNKVSSPMMVDQMKDQKTYFHILVKPKPQWLLGFCLGRPLLIFGLENQKRR